MDKQFHWVYVVRWRYSNNIWNIFDTAEKAKKWVEEYENHDIYWMPWDVE
jgi:hypothetical protein